MIKATQENFKDREWIEVQGIQGANSDYLSGKKKYLERTRIWRGIQNPRGGFKIIHSAVDGRR